MYQHLVITVINFPSIHHSPGKRAFPFVHVCIFTSNFGGKQELVGNQLLSQFPQTYEFLAAQETSVFH